jgi:hypothetical protein
MSEFLEFIFDDVAYERARQDAKWGEQRHPDGTGGEYFKQLERDARMDYEYASKDKSITWALILREEVYEALSASSLKDLDEELNQVMAVAAAWRQDIARRRNNG